MNYAYLKYIIWWFEHVYASVHTYAQKWWTLSITIKSFFVPFYKSFFVYHLLCSTSSSSPPSSLRSQATANAVCFLSLQVTLHFLEFYINGVCTVCTRLFSSFYQSNYWGSPMLKHVSVIIPFYCWTVSQCMAVPQFVHSHFDGHLSYF